MSKMKKLLAMVLALAMVLGMSISTMAAVEGAKLTVKNLSTEATQQVDIYEIYRLDENNNLWELAQWVKTALNITTPEQEAAVDVTAPETLATLKNAVTAVPEGMKYSGQTSTNGSTVEFTGLQAGAYLVLATDTSNDTTYSPMVAITYKYDENTALLVAKTDAEVVAKASTYTLGKEYAAGQDVVEVGDLVTYTIKTTVPYVTSDEATFTLTDTLIGATYYFTGNAVKGTAANLEVTVGNVLVNTEVFVETYNGETTFTLNLNDYVSKVNTYAGQEVVITYTALVTAVNEITNTIDSDYAESVTVRSWTGNAVITKYNEDKSKTLEGATFAFYRVNNETIEYAVLDTNNYVTGEWTTNIAQAGRVTTNAQGVATVYGLDEGTYYFKETIAPDGYKVNPSPDDVAAVVVSKTEADQMVTVTGNTEMTNSTLATLPETGGIGTTIFTIAGCGIMIAAAYLFFNSRRREEA